MIYRIKVVREDHRNKIVKKPDGSLSWLRRNILVGPMAEPALNYAMGSKVLGLKAPKKFGNFKARFWFTEAGWQKYGIPLCKIAAEEGLQVVVKKEKNPDKSRIVYRDRWQVALLPPRK